MHWNKCLHFHMQLWVTCSPPVVIKMQLTIIHPKPMARTDGVQQHLDGHSFPVPENPRASSLIVEAFFF